MRRTLIFLLFLPLSLFGSQAAMLPEKGVPLLQSFSPAGYLDKGKIWDIRSAPNGMVYMAADRGLLAYDGKNWKGFTGSRGFTRSLLVINDSLIYTGSDMDFGVWRKQGHSDFVYESLYPFQQTLTDESEEFWQVHAWDESILFVSSRHLYVYRSDQLIRIPAPRAFSGSFQAEGKLYFSDQQLGLFVLEDFNLLRVFAFTDNQPLHVLGLYTLDEDQVVVTRNEGLFLFSGGGLSKLSHELSRKLESDKVFSFTPVGDDYFAYGTVLRGLYIADKSGRIIHHMNRHKGLPSNTVLSLHSTAHGQLWLGMDYGVSVMDLFHPFTYFYDFRGDFGTGYTAALKDDLFYLGTNQGLYFSAWEDLSNNQPFFNFQLIPQTEGQVWSLEQVGHDLVMGHDRGLFVVREASVKRIGQQEGVWTITPYKEYLLTGNYNGISIYRKEEDSWLYEKNMNYILGSCNQLLIEKDNILWVNIPNYGIIRAELDEQLNPAKRTIFPLELFTGEDPVLHLTDKKINIKTDRHIYVFDEISGDFAMERFREQNLLEPGFLSGFYLPRSLNQQYVFYPVYNGFAFRHNLSLPQPDTTMLRVIIRKAEAFSNHERMALQIVSSIPWRLNNIRIEFILPNKRNVQYQYRLNDTKQWSQWSVENYIEMLRMSPGRYVFHVRALFQDQIIGETSVTFRVIAPWYRKWYAFFLYLVVLFALGYLINLRHQIKLKKQKKNLLIKERNSLLQQAEKHRNELMQVEQKRLMAEYDQLKQQLKSKTIELANKAKANEDKNRLLLSLKEKFDKFQCEPRSSRFRLAEIRRLLDSSLGEEDRTFEIQMDELHQDFFKKLRDKFPGLSNNDLRLCAYLKVGLNSKEIAEILNIQPSSSYISRSRLRKKLGLKVDEDLYSFLNSL